MISVEKINHVYLRVYSDPGIEQELSDFFTFQVPGYKFMPAYKQGVWDGKIRMYDLQRKTLYVGLLKYLLDFSERNGYEVKYLNEVVSKTEIKPQEVKEYVDWLNLHGRDGKIEVRSYQYEAIWKGLTEERTILLSPTASGKSLIIYCMIRHHLEQNRKVILIVPNTSLVEQMYSDFMTYSSDNGWKTNRHCQKLYSGFSKTFEADVLITTWQSIYKQPPQWFKQFDVVFGDEAHQFKAKSLSTVMEKMTGIRYRIGTTGTIDNSKVHKLALEGLFGAIHRVITTKQLMENNQVATLKIKCLVLKYAEETRSLLKKSSYQQEIDFIVTHPKRNKFIRNLALNCQGNTLILFQYVEKHGSVLYDLVKSKCDENRKVFFIYGGTDVEVRESARHISDKENDCIIIASYGVFSTGINIPSIENVIFASPSKSKIRNLQSIGRGLRLKEGKTHCNLFDIADDLHYKSWKNHTLNHLAERVKIYAEEQFSFKILEVELE